MKKMMLLSIQTIWLLVIIPSLQAQPIITAVKDGNVIKVEQILKDDPSQISAKDAAGRQAIHIAASRGNAEMVILLLKKGADTAAVTAAGTSALHFAANGGHIGVVELLLKKEVTVDRKNRRQITPLYFAAMKGHADVVSLLIDNGADPDALDGEKGSPLHAASLNGHLNVVRLLSEKGAAVTRRDINGRTALHFACRTDNTALIEFLRQSGLEITTEDKFGKTGLFYALENGKSSTAGMVSDTHPGLFSLRAHDGSTSLHAAVKGGVKELCGIAIDRGVGLNLQDLYGLTALDYALHKKDSVLAEYLQKRGAKESGYDRYEMKDKYPDSAFPGSEPVLFTPGIISTPFANERDVCLSRDFSELYFTRWLAGEWDINIMRKTNKSWSEPVTAPFSSPWLEAEAFLTPDEEQIFFLSNRPESGEGRADTWEIWTTARSRSGWTEPHRLGEAFSGGFYTTFTENGTMHLTLDGKMQFALPKGDGFGAPQELPESVNGSHGGYNGFVAPDESYLIFSTTVKDKGYGQGDLYITFKKSDGSWTPIVNMGAAVNSFAADYCPSVSPDGKYFFFASSRYGNEDIFWMDAGIIYKIQKFVMK